jgi:putative tryptophan/tyrosine transport system substrate-binding protein
MRRRGFIKVIGLAAAWPLIARAQQPPMQVIGFLRSASLSDAVHLVTAFRAGLKDAGFTEGQNVTIEFRSADDQPNRLPFLVSDLISRHVALIVGDNIAALAAKSETSTTPIIFAGGGDPVREGLVNSLNHPGNNVTGVNFFTGAIGTKRLELIQQMIPQTKPIGDTVQTEAERTEILAASRTMGRNLIVIDVSEDHAIETAFNTLIEQGAGGLLVGSGPFMNSHRQKLIALAARHSLPAIYTTREAALAGGLMSYGTSLTDAWRLAGLYAGRILKGDKPADLPVLQATKFEFVINLKTAQTLGLAVPISLQGTVDEVIE